MLPAVEQLRADALIAALRLSLVRRRASALNAASYLRRLLDDDPLFLAVVTEGRYVLLLSVIASPPQFGLPNYPNRLAPRLRVDFRSLPSCVQELTAFKAVLTPRPAGAYSARWDFGDPASGPANQDTGATATHRFLAPGSYPVTLQVMLPNGLGPFTRTQTVVVAAPPSVDLGPGVQWLCPDQVTTLQPTSPLPPGSRSRWQDGTTTASYQATTAGWYWLEVTSAAGCTARDSVRLQPIVVPTLTLGPDTSACLAQVLVLRVPPQPTSATFRWQDGSTAATYAVSTPGTYWVEVNLLGCVRRDEIIIRSNGCAVQIPNIITPNGDGFNETFAPLGLEPLTWDLEVFNRWGRRIYQQQQYAGDWAAASQPTGLYYYVLSHPGTGQSYKGWVQVTR